MKDIVAFDVETTGLSPIKDYIIQFSACKIDGETLEQKEAMNYYIEPEGDYVISPQAQEKNGLTKEFIHEHGHKLKDIAQEIVDFFEGCDILTYNGNSFDVNFLYCNLLYHAGVEFDLNNRTFYDVFLMYKQLHPSTLEAVYKSYTGKELENAHNALADVGATIEVFKHLHETEHLTREEMNEMEQNKLLSPEKSITSRIVDGKTTILFANGKHKDEEFMNVCKSDPTYIKWFMDNVATLYTKRILKKYYTENKESK